MTVSMCLYCDEQCNYRFNELQPGDIIENKDWLDEYLTEVATVCFQVIHIMCNMM